jgi:hypothetical protein
MTFTLTIATYTVWLSSPPPLLNSRHQIKSNQIRIYSKYLLQKYLGFWQGKSWGLPYIWIPLPNYYNLIIKHNRHYH